MKTLYEFRFDFINDRNNTHLVRSVYVFDKKLALSYLHNFLRLTNELHLINYATRLKTTMKEI